MFLILERLLFLGLLLLLEFELFGEEGIEEEDWKLFLEFLL